MSSDPYSLIAQERNIEVSDKEMEMALALIKAMTGEFDHSKYKDDYREALEKLIEAKLNGEVITALTKAPVADVAEALLQSLNMIGANSGDRERGSNSAAKHFYFHSGRREALARCNKRRSVFAYCHNATGRD